MSWKTTTRAPNPWKRRKIKCGKQQKTTSTSMWQDVNTCAMPNILYIYTVSGVSLWLARQPERGPQKKNSYGLRIKRNREVYFSRSAARVNFFFLRPACCRASHNETPLIVYLHKLSLRGHRYSCSCRFSWKTKRRAPIPYCDRCKIKCATASFRGNVGNVKSNLHNNFVQT